jgi:transcriptional regulator with XRE-family HTH domain
MLAMDIREQFGRILRATRIEKGLTQEELAFRAGMSVPYLSKIEGGRSGPSLTMLADIAAALEVDMADLVKGIAVDRAGAKVGRKRPRDV